MEKGSKFSSELWLQDVTHASDEGLIPMHTYMVNIIGFSGFQKDNMKLEKRLEHIEEVGE